MTAFDSPKVDIMFGLDSSFYLLFCIDVKRGISGWS
jgi:hypothetical protein